MFWANCRDRSRLSYSPTTFDKGVFPSRAVATWDSTARSCVRVASSLLVRVTTWGAFGLTFWLLRIEISVSKQTLSIITDGGATRSFAVGVGTPGTPTPTNVTGYLQARYTDPDQGQTEHRIQLTSLHATAADEPYEGDDGGLIGIHFQQDSSGAISHGCVRMDAAGIAAVDALPRGTLVTVVG